ncbi:MAG: VWA domain-containing protein [Betaproteobacteria bacterium]|nr:VWA domain-containing protein [Betaproteobacteria bacterium]
MATGKLAENVMHFARVLRAAGLPIGPDRVVDALRALETAGIERREDFYWTLAAVFLSKREQQELFDQAFHIFWRDPQLLARIMSLLLPQIYGRAGQAEQPQAGKRLSEALYSKREQAQEEQQLQKIEIDASLTFSPRELLQHADFETMSGAELAQAKKLIARLRLPIPEVQTRRFRPDARGARIDLPATLRASLKGGAQIIALKRRSRITRHPPLVVLCDISGSMSRYSRMFLHFLHAITNDRDRVHTLVFGTRLTNITRHLRNRDVDIAMNRVASAIQDWAGGTRIGVCLEEFNRKWSRRLLGQNAVVLLISDGLDRDVGEGLGAEMERLHKSCRKLVWLNPLLRYEGFQPRPSGVRAMLPHVDAFMPVHNIDSLVDLARELEQGKWQRRSGRIAA